MTRPRGWRRSAPAIRAASADRLVSRLVLDTTVLIDVLRGRGAGDRLRELRRDSTTLWVTVMSIEEVWRGALPAEFASARRLLNGLRLAELGRDAAERAGRWRYEHARRGVTLHQADALIAAATVSARARLATGNPKHFPMPDVHVEHWPVGE